MYEGKSVLALVPARGGSTGVPFKNIRNLGGKPLLAYTLEAIKRSGVVDCTFVSTDSEQVAKIASECGAAPPYLRPTELAKNESKVLDVLFHTMEWLLRNDKKYDLLMVLQPTSPLRNEGDICNALNLLNEKKADTVISVVLSTTPRTWINTIPSSGSMYNFLDRGSFQKSRQESDQYYQINGAIFLTHWDVIMRKKTWYGENSFCYVMPPERSIDIDTELDFFIAEALVKKRALGEKGLSRISF